MVDRGDAILSLYDLKAAPAQAVESRNRESTVQAVSQQSQDSINAMARQAKYQNAVNKQAYYSTPHIAPVK